MNATRPAGNPRFVMRLLLPLLVVMSSCAAPLVQVSKAEPKGRCGSSVLVIGAVKQPGRFAVQETRTLLEAISKAGGFLAAAPTLSVVVERCAGNQWEEYRVQCDRVVQGGEGDLTLRDGDIVHVD